ncbi:MAG: VacJ family lipoprotein [Mariprofundaceae bacterium]|nr:VacJ family lipoprotein [Mariprofundaceae bacterium]
MKKYLLSLFVLAMLSGCATAQNEYDPLEGMNRKFDRFNDVVDRATMKPLALGYQAVTSEPTRGLVSNFFDNVTYLNTVLNDFLQGKVKQGFSDTTRFVINSTLGFAGIADVATPLGFEKHNEDLGQTLAVWGVGKSAYIEYPFLGPNSLRNTPDFITGTATDLTFWLFLITTPQVTLPLTVMKYIDMRSRVMEASNMRDEVALDPYIFTREAWRQHRQYLIYDGHPPADKVQSDDSGDDWSDDDFSD